MPQFPREGPHPVQGLHDAVRRQQDALPFRPRVGLGREAAIAQRREMLLAVRALGGIGRQPQRAGEPDDLRHLRRLSLDFPGGQPIERAGRRLAELHDRLVEKPGQPGEHEAPVAPRRPGPHRAGLEADGADAQRAEFLHRRQAGAAQPDDAHIGPCRSLEPRQRPPVAVFPNGEIHHLRMPRPAARGKCVQARLTPGGHRALLRPSTS